VALPRKGGGIDEREQAGCGEATLLAADAGRGGAEWDVDAGVLPAAAFEGNAVLPVADAEIRGSGTKGGAAPERERGSFALVSEEAGVMVPDLELVLRDGRPVADRSRGRGKKLTSGLGGAGADRP